MAIESDVRPPGRSARMMAHDAAAPRGNTASPPSPATIDLTLLVPVFNERDGVARTIDRAVATLEALDAETPTSWELIAIDDGSADGSGALLDAAAARHPGRVHVLHRADNGGYGAALKWGFRRSAGDLVAMIDADGTYPVERLADLVAAVRAGADMAVGARTGPNVHIPLLRRPAKWFLNRLANFLVGARIPDLNSGLRVLRRDAFAEHLHLLPNGFSLTTTITLALHASGAPVVYLPIDYARRVGSSSIRPIRDTARFLGLIVRTILVFNPLRVFGPASIALLAGGAFVAVGSKLLLGELMDVTSVVLILSGVQMLALGLLADLITRRR